MDADTSTPTAPYHRINTWSGGLNELEEDFPRFVGQGWKPQESEDAQLGTYNAAELFCFM